MRCPINGKKSAQNMDTEFTISDIIFDIRVVGCCRLVQLSYIYAFKTEAFGGSTRVLISDIKLRLVT